MGVGKTSIGKKVAKKMNLRFYDTDKLLEQREKKTVLEIFDQKGEAYFRKKEQETLKELQSKENCVISVGGGLPCFFDNILRMKNDGKVIYLQSAPETLLKRLAASKQKRPLLAGKDEAEMLDYITEKLQEREKFYLQAHYCLDTDRSSTERIVTQVAHLF